MTVLRRANLAFAILAVLAPAAHSLELPNKLALDGPLWLAVQQHLYRGWGPFLGGPVELGAFATSLALLVRRRREPRLRGLTAAAIAAYAGMITVFLAFNAPVNAALSGWTPETLPPNWPSYRLQWEIGHALATLLAVAGLATVLRGYLIERDAQQAANRPRA